MASKKIVYIIVEGPSDETALGVILSRIYSGSEVHVEITHGDITSDENIASNNIEEKINDFMAGYAQHTFYKDDFQQVIHIVDMDGAYIPDKCVVFDAGNEKTLKNRGIISGRKNIRWSATRTLGFALPGFVKRGGMNMMKGRRRYGIRA